MLKSIFITEYVYLKFKEIILLKRILNKWLLFNFRHRGSKKRPTVKYTFGSETKPFYEDLLQKSQQSQAPWQWNAMKQRHPHAQNVINSLTKEKFYEFKLTGKFVDVIGNDALIHYGS